MAKSTRKLKVADGQWLWNAPERADPPSTAESTYQPLPSVWCGSDAELLEKMLGFYPRSCPMRILDATAKRGRFGFKQPGRSLRWISTRGTRPDIVADNTKMPLEAGSFEVIVYDPPHVSQPRPRQIQRL